MPARRVTFPSKGMVAMESFDLPAPRAGEVRVKIEYSMLSPGTELAWLHAAPGTSGNFPQFTGYSSSGRVGEVGGDVTRFRPGDRVALETLHASSAVISADAESLLSLPEQLDALDAATFRIVTIALQGVRKSSIQLGDSVLVLGLGIIGNLAGQIARAAGATCVVGVDPVGWRAELARRCGFDATAPSVDTVFADNPDATGVEGALPARVSTDDADRMRFKGFDAVIEASGVPEAVNHAFAAATRRGRVVLLGSTRGPTKEVDFYRDVHRKGLAVFGAHASIRSFGEDAGNFCSLRTDARTAIDLLASRRINARAIISDTVPAEQAPSAYTRLTDRSRQTMTLALKW